MCICIHIYIYKSESWRLSKLSFWRAVECMRKKCHEGSKTNPGICMCVKQMVCLEGRSSGNSARKEDDQSIVKFISFSHLFRLHWLPPSPNAIRVTLKYTHILTRLYSFILAFDLYAFENNIMSRTIIAIISWLSFKTIS